MRAFLAVVVSALMVVGGARAEGPPSPPPGSRPVLTKGQPAPADGLLATVDWARYDVERLRWLTAERDACRNQPPGGWRPTLVVAGISVTVGLAGGAWLGWRLARR